MTKNGHVIMRRWLSPATRVWVNHITNGEGMTYLNAGAEERRGYINARVDLFLLFVLFLYFVSDFVSRGYGISLGSIRCRRQLNPDSRVGIFLFGLFL